MRDITGQKFGKLTAIKVVGNRNGYIWECVCDCGNIRNVSLANLGSGHTRSCGCLNKGIIRNYKHGLSYTRLHNEYHGMIARCKPTWKRHKDYYDRGILVCEEWSGECGEKKFYDWSLSHGYRDDLTLDRIDNNKGYSPDNCRWVTVKQQANNKRNNRLVTAEGKTQTLAEWSEEKHIGYKTLSERLRRGWGIEDALNIPVTNHGFRYNKILYKRETVSAYE